MKTTLGIGYAYRTLEFESAVTHLNGVNDSTFSVGFTLIEEWKFHINAHPYWHALGLIFSNSKFGSLSLISDNIDFSRAKTLGLMVGTGLSF
jgi:hypothetical protein